MIAWNPGQPQRLAKPLGRTRMKAVLLAAMLLPAAHGATAQSAPSAAEVAACDGLLRAAYLGHPDKRNGAFSARRRRAETRASPAARAVSGKGKLL